MKKLRKLQSAIILLILLTFAMTARAADTAIRFNVGQITADGLTEDVANALRNKLITALTRVEAADESPYNVNIIRPTLDITEYIETEGLMQEMSKVTAELTLTAVNSIDGTVYNSVVIPLSATAKGGKEAAMRKLANSVKPTDAVYVRFVRSTRKRIMDHYTNNCGNIIAQAQRLMTTGRYAEAAYYLQGVQPSVPCFDQAEGLLGEVMQHLNQPADTVVVEKVVEVPVEHIVEVPAVPDTVVVEKIVEVPQPVSKPLPAATPTGLGEVTIEGPNLDFKVLACEGDMTRRNITITAKVVNRDMNTSSCVVRLINAFTPDGVELKDPWLNYNHYSSGNLSMPYDVPVTIHIVFANISSHIDRLVYTELKIRGIKITIRNLPVKW